ncbi:hypothetical protein V8F06_004528 [Rhypophila decipiens]
MADNHRGSRGYPPRETSDGSSYPPPPDDESDRRRQYPLPSGPPSSMSLPPMSAYQPVAPPPPPAAMYPPDPRYPDPRYAQDQRAWPSEPPATANGYAPPAEPRYPPPPSSDRRPYDDRSRYEGPRQYDEHSRQYDRPAYPDPYYGTQADAQRPAPYAYAPYAPQHGYQYPPQQQPPPQQPQAAPRQRTSIACRYCRKRKIRCSGYANTPNGKCTNCDKLKIDCVFQPVSSNASTAFVPVSAIAGGVPPGTLLYGAYGQPLAPTSGQSGPGPQTYSVTPSDYPPPPAHSPTTSQYPPLDDRERDMARRRTRPPEDGHDLRLPPPNYPKDDDPRRRSPSSNHSNGTPPMAYHSYPPTGYDQGPSDAARRTSPTGPPPTSQPAANPMSLNHLIGSPESRDRGPGRDIDRSMLGKLDRRR